MKYLLTYAYEGKRRGERVSGQGSTVMTVTGTDKITPELINDATEWAKNNFEEHTTIYFGRNAGTVLLYPHWFTI